MNIFGIKVRIPPTPAMIPSTIKETSQSETESPSKNPPTASEKTPSPVSNTPFSASPTIKVRKNTKAMIHKNIGTPNTGCVKI